MASQVRPHLPKPLLVSPNYPRFLPLEPLPLPTFEMSAEVDDTIVRPSKRIRESHSVNNVRALQCQVCHRTYDRIDHLNRHLDSHRNERSFRCKGCPAAFNRRDLLLRHRTTHAKNAAEGQVCTNRSVERATKACNSCVISKVKCDNCRPCQRCLKRNLECTTRMHDAQDGSVTAPSPRVEQVLEHPTTQGGTQTDPIYPVNTFMDVSPAHQGISDIYQNALHQPHAFSNFFEQIMVDHGDFLAMDYLQPPPDLTTWLPEADWFTEVDLFGADFVPAIDDTFNAPRLDSCADATPPAGTITDEARGTNSGDAVKRRHAVFRRSPWFWVPEHNQNAFSDHEGITLDERNVDLASSPHQPHSSSIVIPGRLSQQGRDRIYHLVLKTAHSQVSISSFPSADCLDKLIKVGIAKRTEADAWIHPYTFDAEASRPEFLTALVVAGCICFGIPSVNKTGLVLQEIVRVALRELAEHDNSTTRELQYLQAMMLWLDIGAFCGFRRKMEIAESSLQVLVTALRRAGRFDNVRYPDTLPQMHNEGEELDRRWRSWVELESHKRLVYHLFEHDIYMTVINHRQPLISCAELTLPLPASEILWLAPSAVIWKARILNNSSPTERPSMRTILQNEGLICCLHANFDLQIARSAQIHGLASQVWDQCQQTILLQDSSDPSSQLWSRSRQQKLYDSLRHTNLTLNDSSALTCAFHQFLQMFLHADLDAITRFAGKCGEEAAHRAYIALQPWSKSKEARIAIAHAGQVLHAARAIPPYQNRGQDSFIIYHSIMVLWTYSMMINDHARKTGSNTPVRAAHATMQDQSTLVFLDDDRSTNQSAVDAFIMMNTGTPCLRILLKTSVQQREDGAASNEICNMKHPWQVMKAGVTLLEGTHPDVDRETGPPLLRALCGLMEELGGLRSI
ncbi:hypothetical protein HBI69_229430 [Parastagonospora nodorum]|nr:hypothetical protein HBI69_229430 [Parastagonospora nodorum]